MMNILKFERFPKKSMCFYRRERERREKSHMMKAARSSFAAGWEEDKNETRKGVGSGIERRGSCITRTCAGCICIPAACATAITLLLRAAYQFSVRSSSSRRSRRLCFMFIGDLWAPPIRVYTVHA